MAALGENSRTPFKSKELPEGSGKKEMQEAYGGIVTPGQIQAAREGGTPVHKIVEAETKPKQEASTQVRAQEAEVARQRRAQHDQEQAAKDFEQRRGSVEQAEMSKHPSPTAQPQEEGLFSRVVSAINPFDDDEEGRGSHPAPTKDEGLFGKVVSAINPFDNDEEGQQAQHPSPTPREEQPLPRPGGKKRNG